MVRPFATTTPESLVFLPAISPLPRPVSTNWYVPSSLISSVTAPSVALPPPPSAPPTGRNHPLQVPTSSRGTKERDTSDCVRLATASLGLSVAQPVSKTIRAAEARCEGFRLRAGTADAGGEWSRSVEMGDSEQTAQNRTTVTR